MGCNTSSVNSDYVLIHPEQEEKRKCVIYDIYVGPRVNSVGAPKRKIEAVYGNKNPPWDFGYNVKLEEILRKFGYFVSCEKYLRNFKSNEEIEIGNFIFYIIFEVY